MREYWYAFLGLLLGIASSGCALPRCADEFIPPPPGPGGTIFVADGAGNFQAASRSLRRVLAQEGSTFRVVTYEWSHGFGRILADQLSAGYAREQGRRLAGLVTAFRQQYPNNPVTLVGHSAGCLVILSAAECLPPDSLERIVLLAPSVSADYDLRPALRAVRENLDVFYSRQDIFYLGFFVRILGTCDRRWVSASGLVGFRPQGESFEDALLYNKLRQHRWKAEDHWTGNHGGHYGAYQPGFLRTRLLPLLRRPRGELRLPRQWFSIY